MSEEELLNLAAECGFDHASIIETNKLIFNRDFRKFCEMNVCGNYNCNYSCPPDCGTPEDLKEKVLHYKRALVLQTITPVKNILDDTETKGIKQHHNHITWNLIQKLEGVVPKYLPAMAGPCGLCNPCAKIDGKKCRFPEKKASCLSVYCIQVDAMAKECGLEFYCDNAVAFFSMIAYCD